MPPRAESAPPASHRPRLILLPGIDGTEVFFRPLLAALEGSIEAEVLTLPEVGAQDIATLLANLRTRLPTEAPFHLFASSFSGPLAICLAQERVDQVQSLTLCASFARFPRPGLLRLRWAARKDVFLLLRTLRRLPVWLGSALQSPYRLAKAETWRRVPASLLAARIRALMPVDVRVALADLQQPLMLIEFGRDEAVPAARGQEICRLRPDATHLVLPGKHMGLWHSAERIAEVLRQFIAEPSLA